MNCVTLQGLCRKSTRALPVLSLACALALVAGCASDGDYWDGGSGGGVSTSVSVGIGYGSYYGPGWYGGYYEPYPPVVVVPPGDGIDRPDRPANQPSTLPADVGGPAPAGAAPRASTAPTRPSNVSRPTSRPSSRPATRPMPRMGRR
jgi:hypothetical protein